MGSDSIFTQAYLSITDGFVLVNTDMWKKSGLQTPSKQAGIKA
jgi:hypothetical protein